VAVGVGTLITWCGVEKEGGVGNCAARGSGFSVHATKTHTSPKPNNIEKRNLQDNEEGLDIEGDIIFANLLQWYPRYSLLSNKNSFKKRTPRYAVRAQPASPLRRSD